MAPISPTIGNSTPATPITILPLRIATADSARTMSSVRMIGIAPASVENGRKPINSRPPSRAAITTASTERRPSSAQYTSSRCSQRAYSSSVSPAPMPKPAAKISSQGLGGCSARANPVASSSTIPKTRWCTCSPPSVLMLPGHHGTFGLRIKRALVRMNRKESSSDPSRISPARADCSLRKLSPSNLRMTSPSQMDGP
jgi:hypothetical protein